MNFGAFTRTCTMNLDQPSQPPSCS
jgi:hypothetical protein